MANNTGNNPNRDNTGKDNETQKGMGREQEQRQAGRKDDDQSQRQTQSSPGKQNERKQSGSSDE